MNLVIVELMRFSGCFSFRKIPFKMSGEVERQWARFNIVIIEGDRFNGHQHEEIHGLDFNEDDILVLYDV